MATRIEFEGLLPYLAQVASSIHVGVIVLFVCRTSADSARLYVDRIDDRCGDRRYSGGNRAALVSGLDDPCQGIGRGCRCWRLQDISGGVFRFEGGAESIPIEV
jgi:hypothetical protein